MKSRLLIILFVILLVSSCTKSSDKEAAFKINGLDIYPLDISGEMPEVVWVDSMKMNTYGFRMNLFTSIVKSAKYFDENEGSVSCVNGIKAIAITCSDSFAPGFPKGSLLNRRFANFIGSYSELGKIEDNGALGVSRKFYPDYSKNPIPSYADLLLMRAPEWPGTYKFYVKLNLFDNTTLIDSTPLIKLY